jgi:hypothetical protein
MRKTGLIALLAAIVAVLVAAGSASAGGHGKVMYRYWGQVEATGSASVTITVQNGNHPALRSLIGQSQMQTFATDAKTVFLKWSMGKPTVVGIGDLAQHDYVLVHVRADRGASLDTIKATPAKLVGDHGPTVTPPTLPLYLFRGTLVSAGGGKVTIDVKGGNRHALRLMIGQGAQQTFTYDDGTVFLHWEHRIPTVVDPSALKPGDRIVVRVRAPRGSNLAQVEATAARRVADREPKGQEANQNTQS